MFFLDDESNFPRSSDQSFLEKCHYNHALNDIYKRSRMGANEFGITHFGGLTVWYYVEGFLEKNRDSLRPEIIEMLSGSSLPIVQDITKHFKIQREGKYQSKNSNGRFVNIKARAPTVSARFSDSLQQLFTSMSKCNPWFIRCIKPNNDKQAKRIDMPCLLNQLRFLGVLSTVKMRQLGYPVRLRFQHFVERYRHLLRDTPRGTPYKDLCKNVLEEHSHGSDQTFQIGSTRVFLRESLHNNLENLRHARLNRAAALIQKKFKKILVERKRHRQQHSAILLQKTFRGYRERKRYQELKRGVVMAQTLYRGKKVRQNFESIKKERKSYQMESSHNQMDRRMQNKREIARNSVLDVPAELAFIFSKVEMSEQAHNDKNLVKVVGTIPGPPFIPNLPNDLDHFTFNKFCSVYCDGVQLYYRKDPISKPFLSRAAGIDKDFQDSLSIFKLILRWMGDPTLDAIKDKVLADYIVHKGLTSKNLRDEILVQLCNQLHGIDETQSSKTWMLLSYCLSSFQPGPNLSKYLMKYVKDNAPNPQREAILKKLLRGNHQVPRLCPPTYLEWRASRESDIALRLLLPDGTLQTVAIDSWTTCEEAAHLSLAMIPNFQPKGWTVVLDDMKSTTDSCGIDYVLDLIGEREMIPSFPHENRLRKQEVSQNYTKSHRYNGSVKEIEPLKRPLIPPPAPPQMKVEPGEMFKESVHGHASKNQRKTSIDILSRSSALNERYFEFESSRSKSMDDLKAGQNEINQEVETKKPSNETGLSGSRLNYRYHAVEQNNAIMKQTVMMKNQKPAYDGRRPNNMQLQKFIDRPDMRVRSSAMSDTSETPSLASHVRRVRVPSQASDVGKILNECSPVNFDAD